MSTNIDNKTEWLFSEMNETIFHCVWRSRDYEGNLIEGVPEAARRAAIIACLYAKKFNPLDYGEIIETMKLLETKQVPPTYINSDIEHKVITLLEELEFFLSDYEERGFNEKEHKRMIKALAKCCFRFAAYNGLKMDFAWEYVDNLK